MFYPAELECGLPYDPVLMVLGTLGMQLLYFGPSTIYTVFFEVCNFANAHFPSLLHFYFQVWHCLQCIGMSRYSNILTIFMIKDNPFVKKYHIDSNMLCHSLIYPLPTPHLYVSMTDT